MKRSILFVLFYYLHCCHSQTNKRCSTAELETHLAPITGLFGVRSVKFPENKEELDQLCSIQARASKLAKDYTTRCLKGVSQSIMSVTIYTTSRIQKQLCTKKVDESIKAGPCGNRGKKDTIKCWNRLTDRLNVVRDNISDTKIKIPMVCCNFFEWKECTLNVFNKIGAPVCSETTIQRFDDLISRGSIDVLKVICGDYAEESDKCDQLIKSMPDIKRKGVRTSKTPFVPMFEIYESL